jgi:hypothetical protein
MSLRDKHVAGEIRRLREKAEAWEATYKSAVKYYKAKDINELRREIGRLRYALEQIAGNEHIPPCDEKKVGGRYDYCACLEKIISEALEGGGMVSTPSEDPKGGPMTHPRSIRGASTRGENA